MSADTTPGSAKCPKCMEEIIPGAKLCKHCNADLRSWARRHPIMTGLGSLVAFTMVSQFVVETLGGAEHQQAMSVITYDAPVILGKGIEDVKKQLGDTSTDNQANAESINDVLKNNKGGAIKSALWNKDNLVLWVTYLDKKPVEQVCVLDPKKEFTYEEILKKVNLAGKEADYNILRMDDTGSVCACVKGSTNPFCKDQAKEIAAKKAKQAKVDAVCAGHPTWTNEACTAIANKDVLIGMDFEQVIAAWGKPSDVNSTEFANGNHAQFVYGSGKYLYLENGILTSIQR